MARLGSKVRARVTRRTTSPAPSRHKPPYQARPMSLDRVVLASVESSRFLAGSGRRALPYWAFRPRGRDSGSSVQVVVVVKCPLEQSGEAAEVSPALPCQTSGPGLSVQLVAHVIGHNHALDRPAHTASDLISFCVSPLNQWSGRFGHERRASHVPPNRRRPHRALDRAVTLPTLLASWSEE